MEGETSDGEAARWFWPAGQRRPHGIAGTERGGTADRRRGVKDCKVSISPFAYCPRRNSELFVAWKEKLIHGDDEG